MTARSRPSILLLVLLVMLCAAVLGLVVYCMAMRLAYPYGVSRQEGAFVEHALRVASGRPLYGPPSAEFIPMIYMPLSYHAAAVPIRAGLEGFLSARLVSVAALLGALLLGAWLTSRATRYRWLGLLMPFLALARYFDVDAAFDRAGPDILVVLCVVASAAAMTLASERWAGLLAAGAATLAFFTKQSCVVFFVPFFAAVFLVRPRVALIAGFTTATLCAVIFMQADAATGGWLRAYTVEIPSHHSLAHRALLDSLWRDLLGRFGLFTTVAAIGIAFFVVARNGRGSKRQHSRVFLIVLAAAFAATVYSIVGKWNQGALRYVYVPHALVGAMLVPAFIGQLWQRAEDRNDLRPVYVNLGLVVLCLALASGLQNPGVFLPQPRDAATWRAFRETARSYGPLERVWVPSFGAALGSNLDSPIRPSMAAIKDYVGGFFGRPTGRSMPEDLTAMIREQQFAAIIVREGDAFSRKLIEDSYRRDEGRPPITLPMFNGLPPDAEVIYVPRTQSE